MTCALIGIFCAIMFLAMTIGFACDDICKAIRESKKD